MSKGINRLSQDAFYRLCKFIETLKPEIEAGKYATQAILIENIKKATGAIINPEQLHRACRTLGITVKYSSPIAATMAGTTVRLRRAVLLLRDACDQLCRDMGVTVIQLNDPLFQQLREDAEKKPHH